MSTATFPSAVYVNIAHSVFGKAAEKTPTEAQCDVILFPSELVFNVVYCWFVY